MNKYLLVINQLDALAKKICYYRNREIFYNGFRIKGYQVFIEYYNDYGVEFKDEYPLDMFLEGFEAVKKYIDKERENNYKQTFRYKLFEKIKLKNK